MSYHVKEIFYTLQGEGGQAGRAAVFCRFTGCNLWSGREQDRLSAACTFCDTDFVGTDGLNGGSFKHAEDLAAAVAAQWPAGQPHALVVCTGGEPGLQLDVTLIDALHDKDFEIAIETNGTVALPPGLDWICVSPKGSNALVVHSGQELKLVYPQPGVDPAQFETLDFQHFFLQPMDSPQAAANTKAALEYCLAHPRWRLSLQTHKLLGIP